MPQEIFEYLSNLDLVKGSRVHSSKAYSLSRKSILDIAEYCANLTIADKFAQNVLPFAHTASISLSGGHSPCAYINCRLKKSYQLSQFASFYSDRVYVKNFFSNYNSNYIHSPNYDLYDIRETFLNDIMVLVANRPLIEAGIIVPITPVQNICHHCLSKKILGFRADRRFEREYKGLIARLSDETQMILNRRYNEYEIEVQGPEDLIEHGSAVVSVKILPKKLRNNLAKRKLLRNNQPVHLSSVMRMESEEPVDLADDIIQNIIFDLAASQILRSSFVTERPIHIKLLDSLSHGKSGEKRNRLLEQHLTAIVPFLSDVSPSNMLKLRIREEESFLVFRKALKKAIDEVVAQKDMLSERIAQTIHSDIIAPEIARLDQKIKSAKKDLTKSTASHVVAWAAAITFGSYTGIIPSGLVLAAKALGLTSIVADILHKGSNILNTESQIRNEQFYFLWKVKELSKRDSFTRHISNQ